MKAMAQISHVQAYGVLTLYCLIYVLPLYASAATRASPNRSRDDPNAIRARIRAVSCSTAFCSLVTVLLLHYYQQRQSTSAAEAGTLHIMGYFPVGVWASLKALCLTALLFAAPLYESLVVEGAWKDWTSLRLLKEVWEDWPTWRNLVAGPVTEECLFRSAAVPLLLLADLSLTQIVFISPLVFGLAHIHHFYEFRITNPEVPIPVAILRSLLQLSYTSLFGAYATFLYLRTGSLLAVIAVHTFCNCMGLPRVWGKVEPWWMTPRELNGSIVLPWTIAYYVLLLSGMVAWYKGLMPLTDNAIALMKV